MQISTGEDQMSSFEPTRFYRCYVCGGLRQTHLNDKPATLIEEFSVAHYGTMHHYDLCESCSLQVIGRMDALKDELEKRGATFNSTTSVTTSEQTRTLDAALPSTGAKVEGSLKQGDSRVVISKTQGAA